MPIHFQVFGIGIERVFQVAQFDFVIPERFTSLRHRAQRGDVPGVEFQQFGSQTQDIDPVLLSESLFEFAPRSAAAQTQQSAAALVVLVFGLKIVQKGFAKHQVAGIADDALGKHRVGVIEVAFFLRDQPLAVFIALLQSSPHGRSYNVFGRDFDAAGFGCRGVGVGRHHASSVR
jgi:hypothetical protein